MANVKVYVCENGVICSVIMDVFSVLMQVLLFGVPAEWSDAQHQGIVLGCEHDLWTAWCGTAMHSIRHTRTKAVAKG